MVICVKVSGYRPFLVFFRPISQSVVFLFDYMVRFLGFIKIELDFFRMDSNGVNQNMTEPPPPYSGPNSDKPNGRSDTIEPVPIDQPTVAPGPSGAELGPSQHNPSRPSNP